MARRGAGSVIALFTYHFLWLPFTFDLPQRPEFFNLCVLLISAVMLAFSLIPSRLWQENLGG